MEVAKIFGSNMLVEFFCNAHDRNLMEYLIIEKRETDE